MRWAGAIPAHRHAAALAAFPIPERVKAYRSDASREAAATDEPKVPSGAQQSMDSFQDVTMKMFGLQSEEWRGLLREWEHPAERRGDYWERWERQIARAQTVIAALRDRAEQGGPLGKLDLNAGPAVDLSHIWYTRSVGATLAVDAEIGARHGETERVVDDVFAMMEFADALADDPVYNGHRVRWDVYEMACRAIECTSPGDLSLEQAQRLIAHLAQGDRRNAFADSFAGEVLLNQPYFDHPEDLVEHRDDWAEYLGVNKPMYVLYNTPLGKPILHADAATFMEMARRMAEAARRPYYSVRSELGGIQRDLYGLSSTRVLSRGFLNSMFYSIREQAQHESRLDIVQLGLALEQYYVQHGEYPPGLEAVAKYLPEGIPLDVFTGKAYVYHTNVDPPLLYGLGADGIDNGGVPSVHWTHGDVVWRGERQQ